ncbi:MAG TPA: hypothetical protein DE036_09740 [Actinobacteria bacterium]|nr:hypothetical protein [Actinomycetota bacterium]
MITISNSQGSDGSKDDKGSALRMRIQAAPAFIGQKMKDKKSSFKSTSGKVKTAVGVGFTAHRKAKGQR